MPKLLIVDDDPMDRELAARCVAGIEDLETLQAEDGRQALEICARDLPDAVLTDLRMPHLDGLQLVRQIRRLYPVVPVVLMTAHGSERTAVEALAAGASNYAPKVDMVGALCEVVEQVLALAQAKVERRELMGHFRSSEARFELTNELTLISPLVAWQQEELERIGFADDQTRSQLGTALFEALANAMIHGNLEVGSEHREKGTRPYHRLIQERRASSPWAERRVHFLARLEPSRARYVVRDEGRGFDRSRLPDPTRAETLLKASGRGYFLMSAFTDRVEYNEAGNEVRLVKHAGGRAPGSSETAD